jgi:recombinational DNA repair protein RecT
MVAPGIVSLVEPSIINPLTVTFCATIINGQKNDTIKYNKVRFINEKSKFINSNYGYIRYFDTFATKTILRQPYVPMV